MGQFLAVTLLYRLKVIVIISLQIAELELSGFSVELL